MKFLIILMLITVSMVQDGKGPDTQVHNWKNRLILIFTNSYQNAEYRIQMEELEKDISGLHERRIFIYSSDGVSYRENFNKTEYPVNAAFLKKYRTLSLSWELFMVGLDGSVKLHQTGPVSRDELYELVDAMPIRKAELQKQ